MKRSARCLRAAAINLACVAAAQAQTQSGDALSNAANAFNRGDYKQAIRMLEAARPALHDCRIPFYIGVSQYRLHELDRAIVNLASAVICDPHSADYSLASAEAYAAAGDDNRALMAYERVLDLEPAKTAALRAAAALYVRHDMSDKALAVLEKLTSLDKGDANAMADLGAAYAAHSEFAKAETAFRRALALTPRSVSALVGLGNIYFKTNRDREAVAALDRAITLDGRAPEPFVLRGRVAAKLKQYPESIADLNKALKLGAADPEIHYYLSQTYRAMGREEDARAELEKFKQQRDISNRQLETRREAARISLDARRMVEEGNLSEATAVLEKAHKLDPRNAGISFRLAGVYFENKQYDKAKASVDEAIRLAPSQWDYYLLSGVSEKALGNINTAQENLEIAVQLNPAAAEAYNQLGELAISRGDFSVAVRQFARAAELQPQEPAYRANLEAAQSRAGTAGKTAPP